MNTKSFLKIIAGLQIATLLACAPSVESIDRTQPNALEKTQFEGIWYHKATIVDSDAESAYTEGYSSSLNKIRWQITEDLLIGYRSYEFIPYAEGLTDDGRDFFGSPVAAFTIESHFDIQREYNATTGVETNVISENTTDRPWFERQYMRVDWSTNIVDTPTYFFMGWVNFPDGYLSGTALSKYYVQGHEETNINRPIFTKDYFDVTNVYHVAPDSYYCAMMLLYNGVPRCGAGNAKVRLSFRKVDPNNDYESLYYPDVVELKDDTGAAIVLNWDGRRCGDSYDPGDCTARTFPYDEQYGNFRLMRVAFDRERFLTRTGRIYVAGRFNLWQDAFNDVDGSLIPYNQRAPKPIVYWGNPKFPPDLVASAKKMASAWNVPFAETVAFLKGYTKDNGKRPDIQRLRGEMGEDMYQFRQNDCNKENIKKYAEANNLEEVVKRIAGNFDRIERGNVEQVCAAMQYAELQAGKTLDPNSDKPMAFTYQRKGDIRYNFQNYVEQEQFYGPWGVAQFGTDPETGEYIACTANYFGDAGDIISQREVDIIQWLNGDLDEEELFRGDIARGEVVSRRSVKNNSIRKIVKQALMDHERDLLDSAGDSLFQETAGNEDDARLQRMFKGTDIEREVLVTDEILRGMAGPNLYQPFQSTQPIGGGGLNLVPGQVTEEAMEVASPVNWGMTQFTNPFNKVVYELGRRAYELADFFDPNSTGLADFYKGESREKIFDDMRYELYAAVAGHEVGHTLGLRHNFEASMDPMNYRPEFWYKVDDDGSILQYWNNPPSKENPHRGNEYKYASIMDYGFDIPLEGLHGVGSYDAAAIRFQYGQLMDVWDPEVLSIPDPRKYGSFARRCGHDSLFTGFSSLFYWMGPESIPKILGTMGKDQSACAGQYDDNLECDTDLDAVYRELVVRMEAYAAREGQPSSCTVLINDINWLMSEIENIEPQSQNIYSARIMMKVDDLISQEIQVLTNPPEYDDPSTRVDESADGLDNDVCQPGQVPNAEGYCPDGVPDDKGHDWSSYVHRVPYAYCSDMYAQYSNPYCQIWDTGWDFEESTSAHINRYDRDYIFDHFRRDRWSPGGWGSPYSYMSRLRSRRLFHMTNVFRYYLYTRRSAFEAPRFKDWAEAAYQGINFLERVIQTPEPGRYCLNRTRNVYQRDPTGQQQTCEEEFSVGLGYGQGKYLNTAWTDEYYYKANRIGNFYDKLAAIGQMTSSSGFFFRDLSDLFDRRAFSLGYPRVYLDPMVQRYAALIEGDHEGYRSHVVTDPDTQEKYVRYMPFFDEELEDGSSVRQWLTTFPQIEPSWSWSLQYYAMYYAMGNWSSINDYAPEFYRFTKISIKGTPEDVTYPSDMDMEEFSDPETMITYRAPVIEPRSAAGLMQEFPAYYGDRWHLNQGMYRDWSVGSNVLRRANTILNDEWLPSKDGCDNGTNVGQGQTWETEAEACEAHQRARNKLSEYVGYIDIMRKFNYNAEY